MFKTSFAFLHLAVIGFSMWGTYSLSEEEESAVLEALKPLVMDCIEDCGLTEEDLNTDKEDEVDPCFKKCFLKKLGLLTPDGKYDRDTVREQIMLYADNEEGVDKLQNSLDKCFKDKEDVLKSAKDIESKRIDIIYECLKTINA